MTTKTLVLISLNGAFAVGSICGIAQASIANHAGLFFTWILCLGFNIFYLLSAIKNN